MTRYLAVLLVVLAACTPPSASPPAPQPAGDTLTVVLLGTTDVHGRLYNYDYYTGRNTDHGLALLKPLVDSVRRSHPERTFLFDAGDLLQGNPVGLVYARHYPDEQSPIIRAMNLLGYSASAIGNHEFNYGLDNLSRAIDAARFPFVAANIFRAGTQQHAYQPYVLLPVLTNSGDTLLIGVTGNTPPGVHLWDRENVTGTLEFRDVVRSVRAVVAEMRSRGADIVVVLSHGGLEGTSYDTVTTRLPPENAAAELARQEPGIDMILLGHSHRELSDTLINGVLLTQPKNWAASLSVATLTAERRGHGDWRVTRKSAQLLRPNAARADRAFLDSLRWQHERTVEYVNTRIGAAPATLTTRESRVRDTPLIDFINEVQRRVTGADLSASAAFSLHSEVAAGPITVARMAALYPYDNTLKAIRIAGAQLRAYLEKSAAYYHTWNGGSSAITNFDVPGYNFDIVSGVDYVIDISRPLGQRITQLTYQGQPVRDEQTFTLALNNYRQAGGGGYDMIAGAPVVYDRGEDVRELLIEEVRRRGSLRAEDYFRENWRMLPATVVDAGAREQLAREPGATGAVSTVARKRVRVLATNDFHGRLETMLPGWAEGRPVGGAAVLASYFAHERAGFGGPVLLLDGGDIMQGTPLSNLTRGRSTIDYYNHVGYSGAALGNHEFDWGSAVLQERIRQAQFPWLAANIHVTGSDTTPSWLRATALIDVDGVRVGLIGLITEETPEKTHAANVAGLTFVDGAQTIDRWVPELRRRGADFVIVVAHEGATCAASMTSCTGPMLEWAQRVTHKPDLIVAGHTHEVVRTRANGIAIIETGSWGTRYGVADLERITADSVDAWIRGTPVAYADRVTPDSAIARSIALVQQEVGPELNRRIGEAAMPIERRAGESDMGRLIADAQRWKTGAQIAIMNAGGVRAALRAGTFTWGDVYQVHPFGNTLVVLELAGEHIRAALEHALRGAQTDAHVSGMIVQYDSARPAGSRVISMQLSDGTPIRDDVIYRVAVNDFLANGIGDGYSAFGRARSYQPTGVVDLDALIDYIRAQPQPLRPPTDVRLRDVRANR